MSEYASSIRQHEAGLCSRLCCDHPSCEMFIIDVDLLYVKNILVDEYYHYAVFVLFCSSHYNDMSSFSVVPVLSLKTYESIVPSVYFNSCVANHIYLMYVANAVGGKIGERFQRQNLCFRVHENQLNGRYSFNNCLYTVHTIIWSL